MFKRYITVLFILFLVSCNYTGKNKTTPKKETFPINNKNLEQLEGMFERCSFKVPKGLYKKTEENIFISKRLNSRIEFISNRYDVGDEEFISSKEGFIDKYKKDIKVISVKSDEETFEILGRDSKNYIFIKGYFTIGYGHDAITGEGDVNTPFYSMSGILKIQYPIESKTDFDNILPIISKTYTCNFGEF